MTNIDLALNGESLIAVSSPIVSSGNVESVSVNIEADESWNNYALSAVFFGYEGEVYEKPLVLGSCTIPAEALIKEGTLFIGVRGVTDTGAVKTSTVLTYKVVKGAPTGTATPAEPTPNTYQLILSAYSVLDKRLSSLVGEATQDNEIIDARVGADGVKYDVLGTAIRQQFNKLQKTFKITINLVDGVASCDKSLTEILTAYDNNYVLVFEYNKKLHSHYSIVDDRTAIQVTFSNVSTSKITLVLFQISNTSVLTQTVEKELVDNEVINQLKEDINDLKLDVNNLISGDMSAFKDRFTGDPQMLLKLCESGKAETVFSVGDQIITTWRDSRNGREYECPLDVAGFLDVENEDGTVHRGMKLKWHWTTPFVIHFSQYQAFYYCDEELPAGTYSFEIGQSHWIARVGKKYKFTLTKPVPQGGQLCLPDGCPNIEPSVWTIRSYTNQYSTAVIERVTVTEVETISGTSLGLWNRQGTDKLNSMDMVAYGDNRYIFSAYRQWLNSDLPRGQWWKPQTKFDRPPNDLSNVDGFLLGFTDEFRAIFKKHKVVTKLNDVTTVLNEGVNEYHYDIWSLPSLEEMGIKFQKAGEGSALEYWKQALGSLYPRDWRQNTLELKQYSITNHSGAQNVRLRSTHVGDGYYVWIVNSSGSVTNYGFATHSFACAPQLDL